MSYDEREEIESTREWLLKFNGTDFSEELTYVPSQLWKLGVPLVDVVDRLEYLRKHATLDTPVDAPMEGNLVLDYDSFGPWGWVDGYEEMVVESIKSTLSPEPGLDQFNKLPSWVRVPVEPAVTTTKRKKGRKRAKAVASLEILDSELVST